MLVAERGESQSSQWSWLNAAVAVCARAKVAARASDWASGEAKDRSEHCQLLLSLLLTRSITMPTTASLISFAVYSVLASLVFLLRPVKPPRLSTPTETTEPDSAGARVLAIPELLLLICDDLDRHSLTQAARVNRQFGLISQQSLYLAPVLHPWPDSVDRLRSPRVRLLANTLWRRTDLRPIVKRLNIFLHPPGPRSHMDRTLVQQLLLSSETLAIHSLLELTSIDQVTFHGQHTLSSHLNNR